MSKIYIIKNKKFLNSWSDTPNSGSYTTATSTTTTCDQPHNVIIATTTTPPTTKSPTLNPTPLPPRLLMNNNMQHHHHPNSIALIPKINSQADHLHITIFAMPLHLSQSANQTNPYHSSTHIAATSIIGSATMGLVDVGI